MHVTVTHDVQKENDLYYIVPSKQQTLLLCSHLALDSSRTFGAILLNAHNSKS